MKLISLILLLPTLAFSQAFTPRRPFIPFVPASGGGNAYIGLAYRWIYTNYNTGAGTWQDIIQGSVWQSGSASPPTNAFGVNNATNGIYLDPSHFLTNLTIQIANSNCAIGMIVKFDTINSGIYPGIINNTAQYSTDDANVLNLCFVFGAGYPLGWEHDANLYNLSAAPFPGTTTNLDLMMTQTVTNLSAGIWLFYTNGLATGGTINVGGPGAHFWGNGGVGIALRYPNSIGYNQARGSSSSYRLKELWIWTNSLTTAFLGDRFSNQVTGFHAYATNTYSYTP